MSENKKEGGSKVRLVLFLFVLLMEYGSKYSILKEEKFLSFRVTLLLFLLYRIILPFLRMNGQ